MSMNKMMKKLAALLLIQCLFTQQLLAGTSTPASDSRGAMGSGIKPILDSAIRGTGQLLMMNQQQRASSQMQLKIQQLRPSCMQNGRPCYLKQDEFFKSC